MRKFLGNANMNLGEELYKKTCEFYELTEKFNQIFSDKELEKNFDERSKSLREAFQKISTCALIVWLNKNPHFKQAKERIRREDFVNFDHDAVSDYGGYQSVLLIENFFAGIYRYYFKNKDLIIKNRCIPERKFKKIKREAACLQEQLKKYLIFGIEREQVRLINLLHKLCEEESNIYNIKKSHSNSVRQILMKDILTFFIQIGSHKLTNSTIAEISIDIAAVMNGIFFDNNMDKADIMKEINEIKKNLHHNLDFWRQELRDRKFSATFCPNCSCKSCEINKEEYFQEIYKSES